MASATPPTDTSDSEPEPKKTLFEIVLTSTPVILTVVATFLVGQSTGEMTRAQYFRAVASQNQSKAGDQWGFFQAKRTRGQSQEMAAQLLLAQNRMLFTRNTFLDVAQGMVQELQIAERTAIGEKQKAVADQIEKLIPKAEKARDDVKRLFSSPDQVQAALDALLKPKTKKKSPAPKDAAETKAPKDGDEGVETAEEQGKVLKAVIEAIKQKKSEKEIAKEVIRLDDAILDKAIADADRRANEVNKRGKSIDSSLEDFDGIKDQLLELAREYQQIVARNDPFFYYPGGARAEAFRNLTGMLQGDYMAARLAYGARRYEDDARSNQDSAYLYEVKVYLASAQSNKHLDRSKMFLYAMLVAQAGVTISTLALAVRRKSIFWALAALTGLIAIGFGTYVYLDLDYLTIPKF